MTQMFRVARCSGSKRLAREKTNPSFSVASVMADGFATWNVKADAVHFAAYMQDQERKRCLDPFPFANAHSAHAGA
jgi:hypothetical protein